MDKQERNDEVTKKDAPGLSNWIGSSDALKGQAAATSPEDVSTSGVRPQSEGSSLEPVHKKHRHEGIAVSKVSSEKDEKGQTRRVELQAVAAAKKAYKSTLLKRDREKKRRDQFKKGLEKLTDLILQLDPKIASGRENHILLSPDRTGTSATTPIINRRELMLTIVDAMKRLIDENNEQQERIFTMKKELATEVARGERLKEEARRSAIASVLRRERRRAPDLLGFPSSNLGHSSLLASAPTDTLNPGLPMAASNLAGHVDPLLLSMTGRNNNPAALSTMGAANINLAPSQVNYPPMTSPPMNYPPMTYSQMTYPPMTSPQMNYPPIAPPQVNYPPMPYPQPTGAPYAMNPQAGLAHHFPDTSLPSNVDLSGVPQLESWTTNIQQYPSGQAAGKERQISGLTTAGTIQNMLLRGYAPHADAHASSKGQWDHQGIVPNEAPSSSDFARAAGYPP